LPFGDAEPDTVAVHPGDRADRDGHFLAAPQVASWSSTWVI
jgi:hypothetical protein